MRKAIYIFLVITSFFAGNSQANFTDLVKTFPSLPSLYKENQFQSIKTAYEERANLFLKGRHFHPYLANRSDKEIKEEFKNLQEWRNHTWYAEATGNIIISRPDFMVAQSLIQNGFYRKPHLIAFEYNHTDDSYNSSTIVLNGHHFLVLEAPEEKTLSNFFKLLQNYQVNTLIRLTNAMEDGVFMSFPYWDERVNTDLKTKQKFFHLPLAGTPQSLPLRYFTLENWNDNQGIDPKVLLKTLEEFQESYDPAKDMVAIHSSGSVGRTGTFIAGFFLLREIDRHIASGKPLDKLDISIEKIVMQLSLQKAHFVTTPSQYITLYRLVDFYLKKLNKDNIKKTI